MNDRLFRRAGLAARSEMDGAEYQGILKTLESMETEFADAAPRFRHPQYIWGTTPLHTWSRAWEYPYVFKHIAEAAGTGIVDLGSGSTFFPFAIARTGKRVVCLDSDSVAVEDLTAATRELSTGSGSIDVLRSGDVLPVDSESADGVYSISVLEHMEQPAAIVAEIARALKPGGIFVLTFDLDVEVNTGVGVLPAQYERLRAALESAFDWVYAERIVHPLDVLTSKNSPWPVPGERKIPGVLWRDRAGRLHPLVGGPNPGVLTVYGCVLRKR